MCARLQIKDLNSGTFGFVELALDKSTGQQVAIKFIERGDKVGAHALSCSPAQGSAAISQAWGRTTCFPAQSARQWLLHPQLHL